MNSVAPININQQSLLPNPLRQISPAQTTSDDNKPSNRVTSVQSTENAIAENQRAARDRSGKPSLAAFEFLARQRNNEARNRQSAASLSLSHGAALYNQVASENLKNDISQAIGVNLFA